ncbi:conserved hypothetical protein [Roseibium sp. TrichSKD4]|nr:conserved hypothetical protein [Roseibium sp. TrichSKD4]
MFVQIENVSDVVIAECAPEQNPQEAFQALVEDYETDLAELEQ